MQLGLHVYGQKPLSHDVFEARMLTEYAKENKIVTQMGIQIHSAKEYRTAVKLVHDGVIGKIVGLILSAVKGGVIQIQNLIKKILFQKDLIGMHGSVQLPTQILLINIIIPDNGACV